MGASFSHTFTQAFPPKPTFTEKSVGDLSGKVYIVSGANTGVGKELAKLLYSKNAKVWVAARSEDKTLAAFSDIRKQVPESSGDLTFLRLDLADLSTIKTTVDTFLASETRLHVLFNNAGVQAIEPGRTTAQGHEIHFGTNCLGTFLFTKLLTPVIVETARTEPEGSVRVVWVSSSGTEISGTKRTGVPLDHMDLNVDQAALFRYGLSKAGNYLQGMEYARRYKGDKVVSIPLNPGNLRSDLYRDWKGISRYFLDVVTYPPLYGAYTELYAGLSTEITLEKTGSWVVPWGRILPIRKDLEDVMKTEAEGGTDAARIFWEYNEEKVKEFL